MPQNLVPDDVVANMLESLAYTKARYGISDAAKEYQRRHTVTYTDPTPEQWQAYRDAEAHLEALYKYDGFYAGHDGTELDKPQPTRHIEHTETVTEWRARVQELLATAGETPADLAGALSDTDYQTLGLPTPERVYGWSRERGYSTGGPILQTLPASWKPDERKTR